MKNHLFGLSICTIVLLITIPWNNALGTEFDGIDMIVDDQPVVINKDLIFINNPYDGIDFHTINHYKTNLHTHTTESDGSSSPDEVIAHYHSIGDYDILAITDHNKNTWPWSEWISDTPLWETESSAYYPTLGMLAISGNELSLGHHRGSLLNDFGLPGGLIDNAFRYIKNQGGLSLFYHPGRYDYDVDWYQDFFDNYPDTLIGIEVYNQGDRYDQDRLLWDAINKQRPYDQLIWGFSDDDMHHIPDHCFRNYQHLLMHELSETEVRRALTQGSFYFSYQPNGADQLSATYGQALTPTLTNVTVTKNSITIEGEDVQHVEWYNENSIIIGTTETINLSKTNAHFVRAVLINSYGRTYTQPFGINKITLDQLPSSFSWRDVNGVDFTTSIRDQSPFPSCETFAITAAVETMVQYQVGFPFDCDLSEAHLYFHSGGNLNWGSFPENNTDYLVRNGIPDEACWPYPSVYQNYPLNTTAENWQDRTVKINDWWYLPEDINAIKYAVISNGPVPTYFQVFRDFLKYEQGIYRHRWGECFGVHYVCIVGWNDDPGYWIVKNSWGTAYQDEGWFNIAYGECGMERKAFYLDGVYGSFPIVYVDDDNDDGPWKGTKSNPFRSIQEGINAAYDGWCVYVHDGVYEEQVVINKSMTLLGESKERTIIDGGGQGSVVTISRPDVSLSGLTVRNSGSNPFEAGIKTLSLYSNATITDVICKDNEIGVFLNYGYTEDYGRWSWNQVTDCIFQHNTQGMYVHWADQNIISGNVFSFNRDYGLYLESSNDNQISGNLFFENDDIGLYLRATSQESRIDHNDFIGNGIDAFIDGSFGNGWQRNYWDGSHRVLLKPIKGILGVYDIPWVDFDLFPSRQQNTDFFQL